MTIETDKVSWSAIGAAVLIVVTLVGWGMTWRGLYAALETESNARIAQDEKFQLWVENHENGVAERRMQLVNTLDNLTTLYKEMERAANQRQSQIDGLDYRADALEARQPQVDAALANITRQLTEQSIKLGIIIDRLGTGLPTQTKETH